ncbi:MAG: phosphoadenosine phosphosulfate reductase family protein [Clostridiales bacterium]|nr:phosphoadenosine phosphosulfate reductase family protein [Clostridiales bacterium]
MNVHTISDLYQMQSLPLSAKIRMTENRIRAWCDYWNDEVYVSFSGGKDSTVLVDIVTNMGYKDIPLVFADTGLEYPEIREFVKGYGDRVTWLKPKMNFKQVIEKYGYPFFSKEISECISDSRKYLTKLEERENALTDRQTDRQTMPFAAHFADLLGIERRKDKNNETYQMIRTGNIPKCPVRVQQLLGMLKRDDGRKSAFDRSRYLFMLEAPFEVSNRCCGVMKKNPVHKYGRETGRKPITAQMASESRQRTQKWLQNGCNGFDMKSPISNPMSFWTEQDILLYIKQNNVPICSVYGDIVEDLTGTEEVEGQLTMSDVPGWEDQTEFDAERLPLKTTGCDRTGCMFCGYGCHLEKGEGRFVRMKKTHPKQYDYIMRPWEEGGLNYKEIIDWINEHGNLNIRY